MQCAFRVDANFSMGVGHAMRCISVANALKEKAVACTFIVRELPEFIKIKIEAYGHTIVFLPVVKLESNNKWLPLPQSVDAEETKQLLQKDSFDYLIVDHYGLDKEWESLVKPYVKTMAVIDDLANRSHNCQWLLDQSYLRKSLDYQSLVPKDTKLLVGADYALINADFSKTRKSTLPFIQRSKLEKILISFGGSDPTNLTIKVIEALTTISLKHLQQLTVVVTSAFKQQAQLEDLLSSLPYKAQLSINVDNMAELMLEHDLMIGAAGTSSWERCCLGLPAVVISAAENQIHIAHALASAGAIHFIEDQDDLETKLDDVLHYADAHPAQLKTMSEAAKKICDGEGVARFISHLLSDPSKDTLREITEADLDKIRTWRNDKRVREMMFKKNIITHEEHVNWFKKLQANPNKEAFIFVADGQDQGFASFEFDTNIQQAQWGFYLASGALKGTGIRLGEAAIKTVFSISGITKLVGKVLAYNKKSIRLHKNLGFNIIENKKEQFFNGSKFIDVIYFELEKVNINTEQLCSR